MILVSRIDAAVLGFLDCECCGTGCDCGCLLVCPVGPDGHERQRRYLRAKEQSDE